MTMQELMDRAELKELVDTFSNLADVEDAASQGELFLPDGWLEFQLGFDGEIKKMRGVRRWYRPLPPRSTPAGQYTISTASTP